MGDFSVLPAAPGRKVSHHQKEKMSAGIIPDQPNSHLLELTMSAFRLARESAAATAEGLATTSASTLRVVRTREQELDSLDRDIDDLVTSTISRVTEHEARELLACMKFIISLERIGDLLLNVCNRAEAVAAKIDIADSTDLTTMATRLEKMITDVEVAFRTRNLDLAVNVLRADGEMDRLRNLVMFRHLEPGDRKLDSFHVLFMATELERAGDHAKNIAEEICHLISGRTVRHVLRTYDRPVEQMFLDRMRERF
jgi:phosphate transport system protein